MSTILSTVITYILSRLTEASSVASIVGWVAAEIGIRNQPDLNNAVVQLIISAVALIGVLRKEGVQVEKSVTAKTDQKLLTAQSQTAVEINTAVFNAKQQVKQEIAASK
jgi:hypothetical protein